MWFIYQTLALIAFLKIGLPPLLVIYKYTLGKLLFSKRKNLKNAGDWAIVTGATDGIGKAYAKALANDSLNVMLISRTEQKLIDVAKEIKSEYGVETRIVVADFTKNDIYPSIEVEINKLPSIACLVNNVGMSYPNFTAFSEAEFLNYDFIEDIINCNTMSATAMTRMVLPRMLAQNTSGGAIINVSSFAGVYTSPYLSVYGATKSYLRSLTKNLALEVDSSRVRFQDVHPFFVSTAMTRMKPNLFTPSPDTYVSHALDMLGVEQNTYGYLYHALMDLVVGLSPNLIVKTAAKKLADIAKRKRKRQ